MDSTPSKRLHLSADTKGMSDEDVLLPDSSGIVEQVSEHFMRVLSESEDKVNFFRHAWEIKDGDSQYVLTKRVTLPSDLTINGKSVKRIDLQFNLPKEEARKSGLKPGITQDLWVFGKLVRQIHSTEGGEPHLILHFRRIAVLRDVRQSS